MPQLDGYGLIVSKDWTGTNDSGDSLAECRIWFFKKLCGIDDNLKPFEDIIKLFKNTKGEWIRSPYQWTDPKDVSRDQLDPTIMTMHIYGMDTESEFRNIVRNWFRYPNGDLCSPEHIGHFYRGQAKPCLRWLFYISDIFTLINTLIICLSGYTHIANDLNHIVSLCYAERFGGTFISRFAAKLYLKKRDYMQVLLNYYKPQTGNGDLIKYYVSGLTWLRNRL